MSAAKDALLDLHADILCLQEVRDWDSVAELVSVLPRLSAARCEQISRVWFVRSGHNPADRDRLTLASRCGLVRVLSSHLPPRRRGAFHLPQSGEATRCCWSIRCTSRATAANYRRISPSERKPPGSCLLTPPRWKGFTPKDAKVITVIAGDFNTDPTDPRFASEQTFALLREKFVWAWENIPLSERVTLPASGRYPDASFDGFLRPEAQICSCKPMPIQGVSDHFPAIVTIEIN